MAQIATIAIIYALLGYLFGINNADWFWGLTLH